MASPCAPSDQPGSAQGSLATFPEFCAQARLYPGSAQGSLATFPPLPLPPRDECFYCFAIPTVAACIHCRRWFCRNCIDSNDECWDCAYSSNYAQGCCHAPADFIWGSPEPYALDPGSAQGPADASLGSAQGGPNAPADAPIFKSRARSRSRSRTICYIPPPPPPAPAGRTPTMMELRATAMELQDHNRQLQHVNQLLQSQSDVLTELLQVYEDWIEEEFPPDQPLP